MKLLKTALLTTVICFTAAACTTKSARPDFGVLALDTLIHIGDTDFNLQYRFTTIANADKSPALRAIEEANIGYFFELEDFTGSAQEAMQTAVQQLTGEEISDDIEGERNYYYSIESQASIVDTLLIYTTTFSTYTGGAHGLYGTSVHTYSLKEGYELTLNDLFTPEQQQKLTTLIRRNLYEQYDAENDEALIDKGFFPEYIGPDENFILSPEGITFHYNPYAIGCYALGDVEVTISREELEKL